MGNSGTFITTVAALGLVSLLAAQAGQAGESRYIAVQPATGDAAVSAWKAEQVWSETVMEDAMRLDLALVDGALSGEAVARLAAIAPAAGPETVDPDDAMQHMARLVWSQPLDSAMLDALRPDDTDDAWTDLAHAMLCAKAFVFLP